MKMHFYVYKNFPSFFFNLKKKKKNFFVAILKKKTKNAEKNFLILISVLVVFYESFSNLDLFYFSSF